MNHDFEVLLDVFVLFLREGRFEFVERRTILVVFGHVVFVGVDRDEFVVLLEAVLRGGLGRVLFLDFDQEAGVFVGFGDPRFVGGRCGRGPGGCVAVGWTQSERSSYACDQNHCGDASDSSNHCLPPEIAVPNSISLCCCSSWLRCFASQPRLRNSWHQRAIIPRSCSRVPDDRSRKLRRRSGEHSWRRAAADRRTASTSPGDIRACRWPAPELEMRIGSPALDRRWCPQGARHHFSDARSRLPFRSTFLGRWRSSASARPRNSPQPMRGTLRAR